MRTLSTNTVNSGSQVEGLLFVPELPDWHPCTNLSSQYIPENVTRLHDLPDRLYQVVAFAPWFSAACTLTYLSSIPDRTISAFLFFDPFQNTTDTPLPANDPAWNLYDGGAWKRRNHFPVYAISGPNGAIVMDQLSQYSGNMSQVRNGERLSQIYNPSDYIRLYINFELNSGNNLPTLWAFLLIVLAIVLCLVGVTSLAMHYVQRRGRANLRQRILNGEVDLEVLGIKKQRLAQSDIDALPLTTYQPSSEKPPLPVPDPVALQPPTTKAASSVSAISTPSPADYNQPTCPICLDEFIPNDSAHPVRVLPCKHIYHPDCIDRYLLSTSSLCPLCKTNIKPFNYMENCPDITNAMVRRERYARRLRAAGGRVGSGAGGGGGSVREGGRDEGWWRGWRTGEGLGVEALGRWASFRRQYRPPIRGVPLVRTLPLAHRRGGSGSGQGSQSRTRSRNQSSLAANGDRSTGNDNGVEMSTVSADGGGGNVGVRGLGRRGTMPADEEGRREWARRRASMLLGRNVGRNAGVVDMGAEERERSKCEFLRLNLCLSILMLTSWQGGKSWAGCSRDFDNDGRIT